MAKDNKTIDRIQAVWNILGGEEGVDRLIRRESVIQKVTPKPTFRQLYPYEVIMTNNLPVAIYELVEKADHGTNYGYGLLGGDLEEYWMPVSQRESFCKEHRSMFREDRCATLFLHKVDEAKPATRDNLFVARVYVLDNVVNVHEFRMRNMCSWGGERQSRLVVPSPTTK